MALLTTGLIWNNEVLGARPSSTLSVRITNHDQVSVSIRIRGFYITETSKTEYVLDVVTLGPEGVANSNYYAKFDGFEFQFITNSESVEISAWGKDDTGDLSEVYRVLPAELDLLDAKNTAGANESKVPLLDKLIYVVNSRSNSVSVIDRETNALIHIVKVGSRPFGVGVNPVTNRIYVTNQGSDNVSVIDGFSNVVIATIKVGLSPEGVEVNPTTNRIQVTNTISNNVSVINGSTNTVIATRAQE
ncbi:MAG: YncE family protein [Desulfosporosinus sp.]|nr:YncE family protein [Desulfosporosinus sp.]